MASAEALRTPLRLGRPGAPRRLLSLLTGVLALAGAGLLVTVPSSAPAADGAAAVVASPARDLTCADGATVAAPQGRLVNNQWGRRAAGRGAWRQCLQARTLTDGQTQLGWRWEWPGRAGLYAYPSLLVGRSPWHAEPSNDARFPRQISATRRFELAYEVQLDSRGRENLATDLWITSRMPAASGAVDTSIIRAELMVWTHASPGLVDHTQRPLGEVVVGGDRWQLYAKPGWRDATGQSKEAWTLISYHAVQPTLRARIDLLALLKDAVSRGLIEADSVVNGVEFGNEIVSGSGSTWLQAFSVTVD